MSVPSCTGNEKIRYTGRIIVIHQKKFLRNPVKQELKEIPFFCISGLLRELFLHLDKMIFFFLFVVFASFVVPLFPLCVLRGLCGSNQTAPRVFTGG
jgi:hypothetical protein